MTWLELWTETAMAKALAAALLHSLWEGAAIALALAAALQFIRSSASRYGAACLALASMLVAFLATLAMLWPAAGGAPIAHRVLNLPLALAPEPDDALAHIWRFSDLLPWIAPLWIVGVIVFQVRTLAGWMAARRLRTAGVCFAPAEWSERLNALARRLCISRSVKLLESALAEAPVLMGHFRPVILLPLGLIAGLPAEQVEAILAHELAHIARRDYLVNLVETFVESLLFYHPAVWWMAHVIRAERENCCDDVAVAVSGDARGYAAALTALEHNRMAAREMALAATGGNLVKRVRRILQTPELPRAGWSSLAAPLLMLAFAVVLFGWRQAPAAPLQTPAVTPTPLAQGSPYRKWLNEDAAYIITDEERATYKSLTTDAEREAFIEQFWLRRDPTPGTPENEMKNEHYRRIAYANEHFASNVAGWKTDRGRIYITFGPPDEIEDHSNGGAYRRPPQEGGGQIDAVPFQQWRYRYIQGVGTNIIIEFIDPDRDNEYRMTNDPQAKDASRYASAARPQNSFVSTGGDPQVTVTVGAGGLVSYIIEQNAIVGRWSYRATVNAPGHGAVGGSVDTRDIGPSALGSRFSLNGHFTLITGSYTMLIEVTDPTGATHAKSVDFYVN